MRSEKSSEISSANIFSFREVVRSFCPLRSYSGSGLGGGGRLGSGGGSGSGSSSGSGSFFFGGGGSALGFGFEFGFRFIFFFGARGGGVRVRVRVRGGVEGRVVFSDALLSLCKVHSLIWAHAHLRMHVLRFRGPGFAEGWFPKRVVLADVPWHQKPERG